MPTNKPQRKMTVWRLRVPMSVVDKMRRLAEKEQRSITKQAQIVLEEALNGNAQK